MSLGITVFEPERSGVQTGFVVSTVGVTAIVMGVHVVKTCRWGSATARAFGRGGAILGSVGTALMVYAVVGVGLSNVGVELPALSLPSAGNGSVFALPSAAAAPAAVTTPRSTPAPATPATPATPAPPAAAAPVPAPPAAAAPAPAAAAAAQPATRAAEQSAVVQSAGTLAFVMRQRYGAGPFPADLAVGMSAPQRIMLADGTGLAAIPDDARVLYSVSSDGTAWSVTIIGARFGAVATYSSAVGTVQAG
ncbi:hypothetical protein [Curtobacterium sp. PhB130]|uniref:hypothetical protein n=1 Tax=Curtobacterium sp. PhB130 TaxID=2485178 RepID=UPI0011CD6C95|nr:hypothetical protein [Curtobacterium sp. PhB130]